MDFQNLVLLPSQESLLQRLRHIASYSEQLKVVAGEPGSGKSTIVTALVDELDEFNSALVTCPQNADDAEIRRKILVQLLHDPLFDDEVSLADTMLRVSNSLTKPVHIVIDDAQFLSKELWAECLILCQIKCAAKSISITLTANAGFLSTLMSQLSSQSKQLILPITIDPLTMPEREGLYFSLMSRADTQPFTPREIIRKQLEDQSGSPAEVVSLLDLALHGEQESKSLPLKLITSVVMVAVAVGVFFAIWLWHEKPLNIPEGQVEFAATRIQNPMIVTYGGRVLAPYFLNRQRANDLSAAVKSTKRQELQKKKLVDAHLRQDNETKIIPAEGKVDRETALSDQLQDAQAVLEVKTSETELTNASVAKVEQSVEPVKLQAVKKLEHKAYTLQLAKLTQEKSLNAVLIQLGNTEDIFIFRQKNFYIVTVGDFADKQKAELAITNLSKAGLTLSPWVRKWTDLNGYELQKHYPNGEIVQ